MSLYKRRERFSDLSIKIGIAFSKLRLSPNAWTIISIIPALIAAILLGSGYFILSAIFFLFSAFLDLVDGSVARVTGRVSTLGGYLDTIVDRYVEFLIILGLLFAPIPHFLIPIQAWVVLYLFGGMMTTYAKAAAVEKKMSKREIKGGFLERAERLIILVAGIILAAINPVFLSYIVVFLAVVTNITALQRIAIAIKAGK